MRRALLILSFPLLAALGCCCHHEDKQAKPTTQPLPPPVVDRYYEPSHATALAFAPPIAAAEPPLDLSRAGRQPGAFVGYEDLEQTYMYIRTDDRFSADGTDRYERRAIIEKIGTATR